MKLAALAVVLTAPLMAAAAIMYGPQPQPAAPPPQPKDIEQLFDIVTWTPTPCTEIESRLRVNGCPETLR